MSNLKSTILVTNQQVKANSKLKIYCKTRKLMSLLTFYVEKMMIEMK